jgi:hypothetical protein
MKDLPVIYCISDQLMNMINTDKDLLNMQGVLYFLRKMIEKNYVLQRQFSELNVMLPRGSCAALNLNISLERKGIKDKWDCNTWINN